MNQREWISRLKKHLYLLPLREEKEILAYYDELFSDYHEQGLTDDEIIDQLGDPIDVAKSLIGDSIEEDDSIKRSEEKRVQTSNSTHSYRDTFDSIAKKVSSSLRKVKSKINSVEAKNYEKEVEEEVQRRLKKEKEDLAKKEEEEERKAREESAKKEKQNMNSIEIKQKGKSSRIIYDEDDEEEIVSEIGKRKRRDEKIVIIDQGPKNAKYYTLGQRRSFISNLVFLIIRIIFLALGTCLLVYGINSLVIDIISCVTEFSENTSSGMLLTGKIGYNIGVLGVSALIVGLSSGIIIGVFKSIHKRFFVKKFIIRK